MANDIPPLNVVMVGGGIGGLTAAIALRRQGHHVQIFEQSHLASEVGAAITIMPNADSILKRIGVDVGDCGGTMNEQIRYFNAAGKLLHVTDMMKAAYRWQAKTRCVHRAHLHEHLKKIALSSDGAGPPAVLHKGCKIEKIDAETATIVRSDGPTVQGDVLVGADGVHSITRQSIEPSIRPFKGHRSAFRFLITRKVALEDPMTRELASTLGSMDMWYAADRKIVMYPCTDNTILNFVCIHPSELSDVGAAAGYNTNASKDQLLEIFDGFEPVLKTFLSKAEPGTIKVWPLYDMAQLPTYVQGRMALIGDAAHPFLPHLAQGGAQAIEDGVALATMLSSGVQKSDVPLRLELYNDARYGRSSTIQEWTRLAGDDSVKDSQASKAEFSVVDLMEQAISHDEFHHSTQLLRQDKWKQNADQYWRQPIAFGPIPGTPPPVASQMANASIESKKTCETATISFKTSATLLRTLFPGDSYKFKIRDTVAKASFRLHTFKQGHKPGDSEHHMLGLYIHNVVYTKGDGGTLEGMYIPVLFHDFPDPNVSGPEETLPMVYSDITVRRANDRMLLEMGWRGTTWGKMEWNSLVDRTDDRSEKPEEGSLLLHKYIPYNGPQNQQPNPDTGYAAYLEDGPGSEAESIGRRRNSTGKSSFHFDAYDWKRLPTLHHIVSWLAELPVFGAVEASVVDTTVASDFGETKRIE